VTRAAKRHQVVVVGGGFGGLSATKALARADVDVTMVDRTHHHLFQPLLYQVATEILSDRVIAPALRGVIKKQANARTVLAEVTRFNLDERMVYGVSPDGRPLQRRYDTLVVAGRATHAYFGHDEWAESAPGIKTLEGRPPAAQPHPVGLRAGRDDSRSRAALGVPDVCGRRCGPDRGGTGRAGGRTGQQGVAARVLLGRHRPRDAGRARRSRPAVLGPFDPKLQRYTLRRLEKMGVEVRLKHDGHGDHRRRHHRVGS